MLLIPNELNFKLICPCIKLEQLLETKAAYNVREFLSGQILCALVYVHWVRLTAGKKVQGKLLTVSGFSL